MIGKKLGHYEVTERIGAGGMGEVYRARDTKLGRDVALKILPEAFAADAERMSRFEREARVLASFSHGNIASIHGLEHDGGVHFIVLEFVEGEDLSQRLARGRVPLDEALPIARQIAEALEAAHEQGIIHRDLKPANVIVRTDGVVKVLDFGLAKALDTDAAGGGDPNISHSPTLLASGTVQGMILGTAAYMSPEQARGKAVDKRADIWAFGCVLYEILSGQQSFGGETVSDTLASVLAREPDLDALPSDTPPHLRGLMERCLEKDAKKRLRDIGEARIRIARLESGEIKPVADSTTGVSAPAPQRGLARWLPWTLVGVLVVVCFAVMSGVFTEAPGPAPITYVSIPPPFEGSFSLSTIRPGPVEISPDGRKLAFSATDAEGAVMLWVRFLDEIEPRPLAGTDNAGYPFWSADSRTIGFFVPTGMKRVDATGGPAFLVAESGNGKGGTWSSNDTIYYTPSFNTGIHKVTAAGGAPVEITTVDTENGENSHRFPHLLPGERHLMHFVRGTSTGEQAGNHVRMIDLDTNREILRIESRSQAIYAAGHILFMRESALMARPFDLATVSFTGDPFPIANGVRYLGGASRGVFHASPAGVLTYLTGDDVPGLRLMWTDRTGTEVAQLSDRADYFQPRLSPDEKTVAVGVSNARDGSWDIWTIDTELGTRTRFTFGVNENSGAPVWSPDGARIAYRRDGTDGVDMMVKTFTGTGEAELVLEGSRHGIEPSSWGVDGHILYRDFDPEAGGGNLLAVPIDGGEQVEVAVSRYGAFWGEFTPDGRWVAYASSESGQTEVYVAPFPGPGRRYQISQEGGGFPRFTKDGTELFYTSPGHKMMSVPIVFSEGSLRPGEPVVMFDHAFGMSYDVTKDGSRFLIIDEAGMVGRPLTLVFQWERLLERR